MTGPLLFKPLYQERVWGGRNLAVALGRTLPENTVIGESWEIVDRPREQSIVVRGPHAGRSLRGMMERHGAEIMGCPWDRDRPFPILVKWLDCQERLSLQVHPPADIASELGGEPKTENWYVADASPSAGLVVGLRRGVTRARFEEALAAGRLEDCVHRFPVRAGDSMFVRSGRLHAIDAGNLILEIQQNSDTTYRVYDWGRVGLDGRPRQLHVEESLRCVDFDDFEPEPMRGGGDDATLAECDEFRIRRCLRAAGQQLPLPADIARASLLHVVSGRVAVRTGAEEEVFVRGDNILLPAGSVRQMLATEAAIALLTDRFA